MFKGSSDWALFFSLLLFLLNQVEDVLKMCLEVSAVVIVTRFFGGFALGNPSLNFCEYAWMNAFSKDVGKY
jgi:hypothetical protein